MTRSNDGPSTDGTSTDDPETEPMRKAKIVCTLGPASDDTETIRSLVDAGMSVARVNASHGPTEYREEVLDRVEEAIGTTGEPVATLLDLRGPEVRTAPLEGTVALPDGSELRLVEGEVVDVDGGEEEGEGGGEGAVLGLSESVAAVEPGDRVLLDDGRIETTVLRVEGDEVVVHVDSGGDLGGRRGVNVPGVDLGLEIVTEADREELRLAAEREVSYVAASFVAGAADVDAVREPLEEVGAEIPVIAKIERAGAVQRIDEILDAADGVMVARGDLGVECPLEVVPLVQKRIIRKAGAEGLPVITATEMLDSMVHERRPTRAEASDVANAVLDGTDALMLSAETAVGDHPVRVVETMARIVRDVEASEEHAESLERRVPGATDTQTDALARSARYLARDVGASAIVAATESGFTARRVATFRPAMPVVAVTPDETVRRRLALLWGVRPLYQQFGDDDAAELIERSATSAIEAGVAQSGDTVVVLSGMMTWLEGANTTNTLKVHLAAEVLASGRGIADGRASGPVFVAPDGDLSGCPDGAVLVLPEPFDGELDGDLSRFDAIVAAERGMTSFPALVARERGVPMVGGVSLDVPDGTAVTVDGKRGVVYEADVTGRR